MLANNRLKALMEESIGSKKHCEMKNLQRLYTEEQMREVVKALQEANARVGEAYMHEVSDTHHSNDLYQVLSSGRNILEKYREVLE
jgi:isocitrate lyase